MDTHLIDFDFGRPHITLPDPTDNPKIPVYGNTEPLKFWGKYKETLEEIMEEIQDITPDEI